MNQLSDREMIRAAGFAQSLVVRTLAQRLAERGTQAQAVRESLAIIRGHFEAGRLVEALAAIDCVRNALDWRRNIPNHDEVANETI